MKFTAEMVEEIKEQIKTYCSLKFTEDELTYLENIKWIKGSYVNFLRLWHPRYEVLDAYIGDGIEPPPAIKEKIDRLHRQNLFKLLPMATFTPQSAEEYSSYF